MEQDKSTLRTCAICLIRAYQRWISPLYPPCCRFTPSCSQYAIEAIKLHGIVKGCWLSALRILKCNPLHSGGSDPVPQQHNRYKS